MVPVFSYGSNSVAQLRGRVCVGDETLSPPVPAELAGYARVFCGASANWRGAIADLEPSPGHSVLGTLLELTPDQAVRLDVFEAGYARTPVTVTTRDGLVRAVAYMMAPQVAFTEPPSEAYLTSIARMLSEAGHEPSIPLLRREGPGAVATFGQSWRRPLQLQTLLARCYDAGAQQSGCWVLPLRAAALTRALEAAGVRTLADLQAALAERRLEQCQADAAVLLSHWAEVEAAPAC